MKETDKDYFQSILTFGYVYLIILGILGEVLFYGQMGVDILKYSSISDILISPIAHLCSSIGGFAFLLFILLFFFLFPVFLMKKRNSDFIKTVCKIPTNTSWTEKKYLNHFRKYTLILTGFLLICSFIGFNAGKGKAISEKMTKNTLKFMDVIEFIPNNEVQETYILGKNSTYIFHIKKNESLVSITPINGNIKEIREQE